MANWKETWKKNRWKWKWRTAPLREKASLALKRGGIALAVVLAAGAAIITLGEQQGWPTPTWQELYAVCGLGGKAQVPQAAKGAATRVHFLDVGEASATLLEQNGHFALIDAGGRESAAETAAYLKAAGVKALDYVILTHPHADHMGGMSTILETFPVGVLLLPEVPEDLLEDPTPYERLCRLGLQRAESLSVLRTGASLPLGDGEIAVLLAGMGDGSVNDLSPILKFTAPGLRFLCEGDAGRAVEEAALAQGLSLRAELFLAGHHGSSTSNTERFLKAVQPQTAVVSCGAYNDYGHPHREVLRTMQKQNLNVYRTDRDGAVVAYVDENGQMQIAVEHAKADAA